MTIELILSIINELSKQGTIMMTALKPEQLQAFWERHEKRLARYEGWLDKLADHSVRPPAAQIPGDPGSQPG